MRRNIRELAVIYSIAIGYAALTKRFSSRGSSIGPKVRNAE
jgi:hypothetical protein